MKLGLLDADRFGPAARKEYLALVKTPATSKFFEKFTDPKSGVVSYLIKPGIESFQQQSLYYSVKSLTETAWPANHAAINPTDTILKSWDLPQAHDSMIDLSSKKGITPT